MLAIPTWNTLLKSLLREVYSDNNDVPDIDIRLANIFQNRIKCFTINSCAIFENTSREKIFLHSKRYIV